MGRILSFKCHFPENAPLPDALSQFVSRNLGIVLLIGLLVYLSAPVDAPCPQGPGLSWCGIAQHAATCLVHFYPINIQILSRYPVSVTCVHR